MWGEEIFRSVANDRLCRMKRRRQRDVKDQFSLLARHIGDWQRSICSVQCLSRQKERRKLRSMPKLNQWFRFGRILSIQFHRFKDFALKWLTKDNPLVPWDMILFSLFTLIIKFTLEKLLVPEVRQREELKENLPFDPFTSHGTTCWSDHSVVFRRSNGRKWCCTWNSNLVHIHIGDHCLSEPSERNEPEEMLISWDNFDELLHRLWGWISSRWVTMKIDLFPGWGHSTCLFSLAFESISKSIE